MTFDELTQLGAIESALVWRDSLFALARSLGFDRISFAVVASRHSPVESAYMVSNYSQEWREYYCRARKYTIDPIVQHCIRSSVPIIWTPHIYQTAAQRELHEMAHSCGLTSGVSFPIHSPGGECGLISFSASDLQPDEFALQLGKGRLAELSLVRDYAFQSSLKHLKTNSSTTGFAATGLDIPFFDHTP